MTYAPKQIPTPENLAILSRLYKEKREMLLAEKAMFDLGMKPIQKQIDDLKLEVRAKIGVHREHVVEEIFHMKNKFRMETEWDLWRQRAQTK